MRILAAAALGILCTLPAAAQVTSGELIEGAREYDGKEIVITGELIGDPMVRGDHVWVNMYDGATAMGIWLPRVLMPSVQWYGSYKARGDAVRVQGVFHRSCSEHGGDMDIHASAMSVVAAGAPSGHSVRVALVLVAGALLLTSAAAFLLWRMRA
jgi:hypothetical protein